MAINTLDAIRTKVRRLTRKPSISQITDVELDEYINTFVVYDFPEHLRMFNLLTNFTFVTNPYQDTYPTDEISFAGMITNPLYNFQNKYLSITQPVYIAGFQAMYTQSQQQFFNIYPKVNSIASIGVTGDGTTMTFSGVVNAAQSFIPNNLTQQIGLLQRNVLFSSVDAAGSGLALVDVPVVDTATGNLLPEGNLYIPGQEPTTPPTTTLINNRINYATGEFRITFPFAPAVGVPINSQTVPQNLTRPQSLMYYDNKFTVRPVPDQPYRVEFEAYVRPTELIAQNQKPELEEWWQYIAYGAAKKIFEDQMDLDSVQMIMPEFKQQERMCLRRTLVQITNQRPATIYTNQIEGGSGWGWGTFGGPNF